MSYEKSKRNTVKRLPARAKYDKESVYQCLDEGLVCHVGFSTPEGPVVIPMAFGRHEDTIYLHGSNASRFIKVNSKGTQVCCTVTHLDGVVVARSLFNSSMNYRSVVVFGLAELVTEPEEILQGMRIITEHLIPNRWEDSRQPNPTELKATKVLKVSIEDASFKSRAGGPIDDEEDLSSPFWAGVVPIRQVTDEPIPDEVSVPNRPIPDYITNYSTLKHFVTK